MEETTPAGAEASHVVQSRLLGMAFLAALYDGEGASYRDLLGNVLAKIVGGMPSPVTAEHLSQAVVDLLGLKLPPDQIHYALGSRLARKSVILESGAYRFVGVRVDSWQERRAEIARIEFNLIEELVSFASTEANLRWDTGEARTALQFVLDRHAPRIGGGPESTVVTGEIPVGLSTGMVVAAAWADRVLRSDPSRADFLRQLVEGRIISAAVVDSRRDTHVIKFRKTTVLLDTPEVLGGLGYHGAFESVAIRRGMSEAVAAGAKVGVLESTISEVRNVLLAARWVGADPSSGAGMRVRQHFAEVGASASQIELMANSLEGDVAKRGWNVIRVDSHQGTLGYDEQALRDRLKSEVHSPRVLRPGEDRSRAIDFDARALAAVHRGRHGGRGDTLENCGSILVTSNTKLVRVANSTPGLAVGGYYAAMNLHKFLNLMWLRRPVDLTEISRARLAMECAALLKPSPDVWASYTRIVTELETGGGVTAEEAASALYSRESIRRVAVATAAGSPMDYGFVSASIAASRGEREAMEARLKLLESAVAEQGSLIKSNAESAGDAVSSALELSVHYRSTLEQVVRGILWALVGLIWVAISVAVAYGTWSTMDTGWPRVLTTCASGLIAGASTWFVARATVSSLAGRFMAKIEQPRSA